MKKSFLIASLSLLTMAYCTAQVKFPQPSPTQTIKQDFGLGSIELTYSRPGVKGRTIFGDLVPYDSLWRTGANASTKLVFSEPVEIGGKKLDTGTYVLYTIPRPDNWEIIINKGINKGLDEYSEKEDVVRFKVPAMKLPLKWETLTMQFAEVKPESCELRIVWDQTGVAIPITTSIKEKLKNQIDAAMQTDKKPYWDAAKFYYEYEKNLSTALENVNKAIEGNQKGFWMYLYKARIQKDMGDKAGALLSSNKSMELAKEANNHDYVKLNQKFQKELQ